MQAELFIHGPRNAFYGQPNEADFFRTFDNSNETDEIRFITELRRSADGRFYVYYSYCRYANIFDNVGRKGAYLGITLRLDAYYANLRNVYTILESAFAKGAVGLLLEQTQFGYQYLVDTFDPSLIKEKIEKNVGQSLSIFISAHEVYPIDSTFAITGHTVLKAIGDTDNLTGRLADMKQHGKIIFSSTRYVETLQLLEQENQRNTDRLNQELEEAKRLNGEQAAEISEKNKRIGTLTTDVDNLIVENKSLQDKLGPFEKQNQSLSNSLNALERKYDELERKNNEQEKRISQLKKEKDDLNNKIQDLKNSLDQKGKATFKDKEKANREKSNKGHCGHHIVKETNYHTFDAAHVNEKKQSRSSAFENGESENGGRQRQKKWFREGPSDKSFRKWALFSIAIVVLLVITVLLLHLCGRNTSQIDESGVVGGQEMVDEGAQTHAKRIETFPNECSKRFYSDSVSSHISICSYDEQYTVGKEYSAKLLGFSGDTCEWGIDDSKITVICKDSITFIPAKAGRTMIKVFYKDTLINKRFIDIKDKQ